MKLYQAVNDWFLPLPVKPFATERDAVAHIKAVQETNDGVFHVVELNVTSTIQQARDPARSK
jgi:hypothetical protein